MTRQNPAKRDQNDRAVAMGVSSTDSVTPIMLAVDPVTNYLLVSNSSDSITIVGNTHRIDQNHIPTVYGVSDSDGLTLIPIRTDSNGVLLVQYT